MENQIPIPNQEGLPFMKYLKNIFLIIIVVIFIIFLCILFVKFGSNSFLWETPKKINEATLSRPKRGIEERFKEMKEHERVTIDMDFLKQLNTTEILETQVSELKKEIEHLRTKEEVKVEVHPEPIIADDKKEEVVVSQPSSDEIISLDEDE